VSLVAGVLLGIVSVHSEPVPVRFTEGLVHGFLKLSAMDGSHLADGDLIQTAKGNLVTSQLVFHFKDGSLQDEHAVFSQRQQFRFVSYRLVQKGPAFPRPLEMSIESSGQATVQYTDEHGARKTEAERLEIPADLANGVILTLMKNIRPDAVPKELSLVVATPKPRLIKLKLAAPASEAFSLGTSARRAAHYVLKVDIGGLTGLVAPLVGKQPPNSHVWILEGEAPAFVKSEQQFYMDGPLWQIELVSPAWPR
jgi:hypothetical protein